MIKLFDDWWKFVTGTEEVASEEVARQESIQQTVRWLKEFDSAWELAFNEPGPFYDREGNLKVSTDFATAGPYIIKLATEAFHRARG